LSLLEVGARHLGAKRWTAAVETFRKVTRLAPNLAEARAALGAALLALSRYEEAVPELQAAAERLQSCQAWNNLGWASLMAGRMEEARAALVKAIEIEPTNLEPQRNLAALFETLTMPKEAEAAYDLILLTAPDDPEAMAGKARCQGRLAAASLQASGPAKELMVLRNG
jgi:Flp pilus assembly protein TadD